MKAGYVFAAALLLAGCSKPASETNVQEEVKTESAESVSALKARISNLVAQCNRIAIEREILSAKYNALINVYRPGEKLDKFVIDRCSEADSPIQREENKPEGADAKLAAKSAVKRTKVQPPQLCWEGYCPCEPPQGGPDQLLCDSLRRGEVDPKMLSVGKSMRKARAEMSEF
jgi:hypothetical protein